MGPVAGLGVVFVVGRYGFGDVPGDVVALRPPLQGITQLDSAPGTVALLCTMIGSTSFDGLERGPVWSSISPHLERAENLFVRAGFESMKAFFLQPGLESLVQILLGSFLVLGAEVGLR